MVFQTRFSPAAEVRNAQLKMLLHPQRDGPTVIRVQVNQVLNNVRRRFVSERTIYLSNNKTKWCDLDVTSAVQSWLQGDLNLGLELTCLGAKCNLIPIQAAISALVYADGRMKRSSPYQSERRTDCHKGQKGTRKCCRQNMKVNFKKLVDIPEMNFILEPKVYEAGYCYGQCPPNYNHATNHSRIHSLIYQMKRKNSKTPLKKWKSCCSPSKLGPLEILLVNKNDPSKLMVEKWDNMQVIECACS